MKINFLGTGTSQGIPIIGSLHPVCLSNDPRDKRCRSSILIEKNKKFLLIDCGPDFRYQMISGGHNYIDAILLTHEHSDHTLGLDDIRPLNNIMNHAIPLYALPRVLDEIKHRFYYFFDKQKYPGVSNIKLFQLNIGKYYNIAGMKILPLLIWHGKLPILGYRIEQFAYITDASFIPEDSLKALLGLKVLVINALRKMPQHPSHFTLFDALNIINILKPQQSYLTHVSHLLGFHSHIINELPFNVTLAYDGLNIIL